MHRVPLKDQIPIVRFIGIDNDKADNLEKWDCANLKILDADS